MHERLARRAAQRLPGVAADPGRHGVRLAQRVPGRLGVRRAHAVHPADPGRVHGVHDAAEQRDAEPGPELVGRLPDGCRSPGLPGGNVAEHRLVRPEQRGLQAETEQHEAERHDQRAVVVVQAGERQHGHRREGEAHRDHAARAETLKHPGAGQPRGDRGQAQREQPQPGLQRREPQDELQVLGGDERQADQGQHRQHDAAHRGTEGGPGERREVDQRHLAPPLPAHERGQQPAAESRRRRGARGEQITAARPFDRQDHGEETGRGQQRAAHVPRPPPVARGLGEQQQAHRQAHGHQRDVDQEDRAPPEVLQQHASDQRAYRGADGRDRAPDADGQGPFTPVGEHLAQDRESGRHDHRAADAQQAPGQDEHRGSGRPGGERGGQAEAGVADQQHPPAPDAVAEGAEEDEQRGAGQRVDVDDPQQFHAARPQVLGHGGDGDVQHGGVDGDEEQTGAEHDEYRPAAAVLSGNSGRGRPGHQRTSLSCAVPSSPRGSPGGARAPGTVRRADGQTDYDSPRPATHGSPARPGGTSAGNGRCTLFTWGWRRNATAACRSHHPPRQIPASRNFVMPGNRTAENVSPTSHRHYEGGPEQEARYHGL